MSAWWGRKCSKNKGIQQQQVVYHDSLRTHLLNLSKSSTKNDNTKGKDKEMPTSLVNDFDGYSVFSGFDSDSGDRSGPRENGNMCAIKEVRAGCDDQKSRACLKQLNQEINFLSQFSHPNICQYYGSELGEETLSVYMEYVSGGSIHKLLEEYGSFRESTIQNYTRQIISGLAYSHGINTVHRDIRGANILVNVNGEIKLANFGMAKHLTGCFSMLSTKGKPYWKAPEVITNTNGPSLAGDIWSVGCTVLEMATSKPPWGQYEQAAAMFKILNSKDGPEIPEHLSNDARSFIELCLQRDLTARPTALQLLHHPFIRRNDIYKLQMHKPRASPL